MRNLILIVGLLLTTITLNAQVTSCSVDFMVTPLNWEVDAFQFGMDMVYNGITHEAIIPWDTNPTFNPLDMDWGDTQYIISVLDNSVVVDQYIITAVDTGNGCLIEFTPNMVLGQRTQLSINARL